MRTIILRGSFVVCLLGWAFGSSAQRVEPRPPAAGKVSRDASAFSLKAEAALQKAITIEATDLPLGDLLKELSQEADVSLLTIPKTEDQRVTLHLTAQPLYQVMTRLCGLLSHSPSAPRGYFWTKESRADDPHPRYRLARDLRSLTEEQEALDIPRRKAARLLRDWRDLSKMSVAQRKRYKGDLPLDYVDNPESRLFQDALTDASDSQIDTLVQSGSIPLNTARFGDKIASFNKIWHDREIENRQGALQSGGKDPYPDGVPDAPPDPPTVTFAVNDENGEQPEQAAIFGLKLNGVQTYEGKSGTTGSMHMLFTPLRKLHPPFPETARPGDPIIDLTPALTDPEVTVEQKGDMGFTLQALAKVAGISVYQEEFYKTGFWGGRPWGLKVLKGTVPQLLNAICAAWEYDAEKVGADYVLWSTTWALDRTFDIPERLFVRWRSRYEKQKGFTLDDRIEIVSGLTWGQIFLTLEMHLPEAGPWNIRREAEDLWFIGSFSVSERAAMAREGLPIAVMSPQQQAALLGIFRSRGVVFFPNDVLLSRLFLEPNPRFQTEGNRSSRLEVRSETGKSVWMTGVSYQTLKEKAVAP
ncbi:MAG: hypothetical protein JWL77_5630 [Chthonomonadaceae bacterium]|nr:hypothetical protein [Chthonomonadaceae bacterium]